jgi:hypothetical protein
MRQQANENRPFSIAVTTEDWITVLSNVGPLWRSDRIRSYAFAAQVDISDEKQQSDFGALVIRSN